MVFVPQPSTAPLVPAILVRKKQLLVRAPKGSNKPRDLLFVIALRGASGHAGLCQTDIHSPRHTFASPMMHVESV
jgi:hypothetical protein